MRAATVVLQTMKRALLFAALAALLVRAAVPVGYMLVPAARSGALVVALCSDHGGAAVMDLATGLIRSVGEEDRPSGPSDESGSSRAHASCVFASAPPLAPPMADVAVGAPRLLPAPIARLRLAAMPGRGLAAPPPLSTGPPRLA